MHWIKYAAVLFVNKCADSKNLSRSEGVERREIFSQAQQPPTTTSGKRQVTGWNVFTNSNRNQDRSSDKSSGGRAAETGIRRRRKQTFKNLSQVDFDRQRLRDVLRSTPPPLAVEASKLDPFDCAAVVMDPYMTEVLSNYCHGALEHVFAVRAYAERSLRYHLIDLADSAELSYLTLCVTARGLYLYTSDHAHAYRSLQFRGRAIHHLQLSVDCVKNGEAPTAATALAISPLLYLECVQGDMEAARYHHAALRQKIAGIGLLEDIASPARRGLKVPAHICSAMLGERPILFPTLDLNDDQKELFLDELIATLDLAPKAPNMASRFFSSWNKRLIGPRLCDIIRWIRNIEQTYSRWYHEKHTPTRPPMQEIYISQCSIERELLDMLTEPDPFTPEQQSVRLALYLCCESNRITPKAKEAFDRSMAMQVRSKLDSSDIQGLWSMCPDLLLWTVTIAANACQQDAQASAFNKQAAELRLELGIRSDAELDDLLSGFLYPRKYQHRCGRSTDPEG